MFELANPWVLLLLILPPLIWFLVPRAVLKLSLALQVPFYDTFLRAFENKKQAMTHSRDVVGLFVIWSLLLLAAAEPRWIGAPIPMTREGRNIMLVLDLSGSMELTDMMLNGRRTSRIAVVKRAATEFVKARTGDKVGLILFGTRAYLQTPLTFDLHSVLLRIDDATVGLAGKTTSIGDALGLAIKRLQSVPKESRVIILLTDGANNSGVLAPLKAAEIAQSDSIKIYTIGLGTDIDPNAYNGALFNFNAGSDLDEETLKTIAKMTDGRYFRATDTTSLDAIYNKIHQLEAVSQEEASVRPEKNYYPWPLALAFLMVLYAFTRKIFPYQKAVV